MRYAKVSVAAADPPFAVVKAKLVPAVLADRYNAVAAVLNAAAAAFVGTQMIMLLVATLEFVTVVLEAAESVNVPNDPENGSIV